MIFKTTKHKEEIERIVEEIKKKDNNHDIEKLIKIKHKLNYKESESFPNHKNKYHTITCKCDTLRHFASRKSLIALLETRTIFHNPDKDLTFTTSDCKYYEQTILFDEMYIKDTKDAESTSRTVKIFFTYDGIWQCQYQYNVESNFSLNDIIREEWKEEIRATKYYKYIYVFEPHEYWNEEVGNLIQRILKNSEKENYIELEDDFSNISNDTYIRYFNYMDYLFGESFNGNLDSKNQSNVQKVQWSFV